MSIHQRRLAYTYLQSADSARADRLLNIPEVKAEAEDEDEDEDGILHAGPSYEHPTFEGGHALAPESGPLYPFPGHRWVGARFEPVGEDEVSLSCSEPAGGGPACVAHVPAALAACLPLAPRRAAQRFSVGRAACLATPRTGLHVAAWLRARHTGCPCWGRGRRRGLDHAVRRGPRRCLTRTNSPAPPEPGKEEEGQDGPGRRREEDGGARAHASGDCRRRPQRFGAAGDCTLGDWSVRGEAFAAIGAASDEAGFRVYEVTRVSLMSDLHS
jgi:hypothetical protein